jgi:hypothetical protein
MDPAACRSIVRRPGVQHAPRTEPGTRIVAAVAFILQAGAVFAQATDLVDHNGFEQCWSQALAKDAFLTLLAATVEGTDACIPAAVDGSSCATSTCTDGSPGCAVTLRAGQYSYAQILPANGQMLVNASTGFDPFSMPVVLPVVGACTINFIDTTNVAVQSALTYSLQPDGNSGYYVNDLLIGTSTVIGLSSDKLSLSGSFSCQIANLSLGFYTATLGDQLAQTFPAAYAPTIGESLCPLP